MLVSVISTVSSELRLTSFPPFLVEIPSIFVLLGEQNGRQRWYGDGILVCEIGNLLAQLLSSRIVCGMSLMEIENV